MSEKDVRGLVEAVTGRPGYTSAVGTRVVAATPGRVEMALGRRPDLVQANGFFHGGVITGIADHAAGAAVTTALPEGQFAVTVSLQINFLAPANGDTLIARARAVQAGRTFGVAQVDVSSRADGAEQVCAIATVTLRVVDPPGVARDQHTS
jgi:uncharacterized protein (TIGR00369 family)